MKQGLGKHKYKYLPITIYLIIFIVLVDVLAIVLYSNSLDSNKIAEEKPYVPGQTDPVKIDEIPVDTPIKVDKESGCTDKVIKQIEKEADNVVFEYEPYKYNSGSAMIEDGGLAEQEEAVNFDSYKVVIKNLSENLSVSIKSDENPSSKYNFSYSDVKDGSIKFVANQSIKSITYYVTIKSSNAKCGVQEIKKMTVKTPLVNQYHFLPICEGKDYVKECAYFAWENITPSKVMNAIKNVDATTTTTTTTTVAGSDQPQQTTTIVAGQTTTQKVEKPATEEKKDEKEKFKLDNVMISIIAVGVIAIIIVIAGAFVISKKRG